MCDLMAALTVGSGVLGFIGQQQQASAQLAYQEAVMRQHNDIAVANRRSAVQAQINQSQAELVRQQQMEAQASQDIQQTRREAAQARATARVSAGEAGVTGLSVAALINDFVGQESRYVRSVARNVAAARAQTALNLEGYRAQAEGRIASVQPPVMQPVQRPSFLGTALRVAAEGIGGYYQRRPEQAEKLFGF